MNGLSGGFSADKGRFANMIPVERNSKRIVLLVDDDQQVLKLSRTILAKADYVVISADNAPTALRISREHRGAIDVLLTDVELRGTDGITLARTITNERPETAALLTSGTPDYQRQSGFAFLPKPFTSKELLVGMATALKRPGTGRRPRLIRRPRPNWL
jgi:DNA-binding NtrC family response regulator